VCLELWEKANEDSTFTSISRFITVMKVGFTVMIQKQSNSITIEEPTITKSRKGAAGPELNKEHAHCYS
jgi:hypothetical protein